MAITRQAIKTIRKKGSSRPLMKDLKRAGMDFRFSSTSSSRELYFEREIKSDNGDTVIRPEKHIYSNRFFSPPTLGKFQKIKKVVTDRIATGACEEPPAREKSCYFRFNAFLDNSEGKDFKEATFRDVVEVDINKAYFNALHHLGYIDESTRKELMEAPKDERLAIVGSLATKRTTWHYKKGEPTSETPEIRRDEVLTRVFFHVVKYVDDVLFHFSEICPPGRFLFYWVDGIYVRPYEGLKRHIDLLEATYGITFSRENIRYVRVEKRGDHDMAFHVMGEDGERLFRAGNIHLE